MSKTGNNLGPYRGKKEKIVLHGKIMESCVSRIGQRISVFSEE